MNVPFFFAEHNSPAGDETLLDEETSRHIVQVLRKQQGERIRLTDGRGHLIEGEITHAHKNKCTVRTLTSTYISRPLPSLTIAVSLIKNSGRFEWFSEKATELGTAEIIPMICDRTEKQHMRSERLVSICKSAMLQSEQLWMPVVREPLPFKTVTNQATQHQKLFGHISPQKTENLASAIDHSLGSHIILIGPEGDFSKEEIDIAKSQGFEGVSFGNTILRVETAAIYAAVVHTARR